VTPGALAPPFRRTGIVAAVSGLAGALLVLAFVGAVHLTGGSPARSQAADARVFTAPHDEFAIAVPRGWSALRGDDLAHVNGSPAAVLRADGGRGSLVVRRIAPLAGDLRTVARELTAQLRARVPGFKLVSARLGRTRAGGAFLYTFVRGGGAVQSLTITKVHGATYRIDSVVPAGAPETARAAGAAAGSFGP
jgi:hypothetical protein